MVDLWLHSEELHWAAPQGIGTDFASKLGRKRVHTRKIQGAALLGGPEFFSTFHYWHVKAKVSEHPVFLKTSNDCRRKPAEPTTNSMRFGGVQKHVAV
jgi:hypothetical protein